MNLKEDLMQKVKAEFERAILKEFEQLGASGTGKGSAHSK